MNGYWILLEDINSASIDVITVLTALLENKSLSVPGYRDCIKIAPGFQLFLTQRYLAKALKSKKRLTIENLYRYMILWPSGNDEG